MKRIENYFDIKDGDGDLLNNKEVNEISTFFSPVIYEVLIRIM